MARTALLGATPAERYSVGFYMVCTKTYSRLAQIFNFRSVWLLNLNAQLRIPIEPPSQASSHNSRFCRCGVHGQKVSVSCHAHLAMQCFVEILEESPACRFVMSMDCSVRNGMDY